jgi:CRP-like cAMP-binding protein
LHHENDDDISAFDVELFEEEARKVSLLLSKHLSVKSPIKRCAKERPSSRFSKIPLFIQSTTIKSGKAFGELALIKNKPRAATIKCLEDCHFAVMQKIDFDKVL